jgi:hypothetical protein
MIVREFTARLWGKLETVDESMVTAFQNEFVIITDCELPGGRPSDQDEALSQLPPAEFIQELTWAKTDVEVNIITDATRAPVLHRRPKKIKGCIRFKRVRH